MFHLTSRGPSRLVYILLLAALTIGCSSPATITTPKPAVPAAAPPATTTTQPSFNTSASNQSQKVIFQDDFRNRQSGWAVFSNDFGEGKYENGAYSLKCIRSSLPKYKLFTTNSNLTPLTSFMLDMDITMLTGSYSDHFGILIKWPDINPMDTYGTDQPSDYYFVVSPANGGTWSYTKQEIKGLSADKSPGYFMKPRDNYSCVKGINTINNIKIWFNPNIRFAINGIELFDLPDENMDYVNRLIKNKTMPGGTLQIIANTEKAYGNPVFQLNKLTVYSNNP